MIEQKLTLQNLISAIDLTVLDLMDLKKRKVFSEELLARTKNIFEIIKTFGNNKVNNESNKKRIYIDSEVLELIQDSLIISNISKDEIDKILLSIESLKKYDVKKINELQSFLIKISLPIWNKTYKPFNG
ncbi:MAG: hypothetical protein LCH54_02940 [Bacteroidetes bacterium]|nr:hypothetical protein [Bacteroidota bacterium]